MTGSRLPESESNFGLNTAPSTAVTTAGIPRTGSLQCADNCEDTPVGWGSGVPSVSPHWVSDDEEWARTVTTVSGRCEE